MSDLYTFKKTSNHVKFFKWIWGVDPTVKFKSMCPYFWSYVATIIFLPIILLIKLFGKQGEKLNSFLYNYRSNREDRLQEKLRERVKAATTPKEAYQIMRSRCFRKYKYIFDYVEKNKLYELSEPYYEEIAISRKKREEKRVESIETAKDSKFLRFVAWIVIGVALGGVVWVLYYLISMAINRIDWPLVGEWTIYIVVGVGALIGLYHLLGYLIRALADKLRCMKMPKCRLCQLPVGAYILSFFSAIAKGILIIINMIYSIYKKNCPLITWEEQ